MDRGALFFAEVVTGGGGGRGKHLHAAKISGAGVVIVEMVIAVDEEDVIGVPKGDFDFHDGEILYQQKSSEWLESSRCELDTLG